MQRDLQITPRRLEYTREKEGELFTSLMAIANRKQEEMKDMIVETLGSMKEQLLEDAANLEFTGQLWRTLGHTWAVVRGHPSAGPWVPARSLHIFSRFPQIQNKNKMSINFKVRVCVSQCVCDELVNTAVQVVFLTLYT